MIRIYERSLCQSYASAYRQGIRFESAGAAALATYGYCGSSNIVRAVRTGCKAGGHYWKRADEEDK